MDADFSVELGADDPVLEVPWSSDDGSLRYIDLRANPQEIDAVEEARQHVELRDFLVHVNSERSMFATAKCDVWTSDELELHEDIYSATTKFSSYLDLVPASGSDFELPAAEELARRIVRILESGEQLKASVEIVIRRLYRKAESDTGLYFTAYTNGYGDSEETARSAWAAALQRLWQALEQVSNERRA